jgi:hypothetical protein
VGALVDHALAVHRRQLGRGQPHVAAEPDVQVVGLLVRELPEHPRERPPDLVRDLVVDLLAVEASDVVGLEDAGVDLHGAPL